MTVRRQVALARLRVRQFVENQEDKNVENNRVEEDNCPSDFITHHKAPHTESDLVVRFEVHVLAHAFFLVEGAPPIPAEHAPPLPNNVVSGSFPLELAAFPPSASP